MKRKDKGITLIALVITIVVLLILAAISINAILGDNGILSKTRMAKDKTDKANIREYVEIAVNGSYNLETFQLDSNLLQENLSKINGYGNDFCFNEENNGYEFTINDANVTISADRKIEIQEDADYSGGGDGDQNNITSTTEVIYDRGVYADGWAFSTDNTYCNNKPTEYDEYWDMAGSSFRLLWINRELDLSEYDKAELVVDNIDILGRIWFALYPNQTNNENVIYACDSSNTTITMQEDGLYLIEWDLNEVTRKAKFGMSAWGGDGTRKLYKLAFHKVGVPKNEKIIYDYGTIASDCQLLTEHDFSSKGDVYVNDDNYEIASNGGFSVLYTNQIDFTNYTFLNIEISNIGSLERIYIRKDPSQVNHGDAALMSFRDSGDNRRIVDTIDLGNGKYRIRLYVKNLNETAAVALDAYAGYGNRKVYKIWLE